MNKPATKTRVECFFDCSSPWSYLGFHNLRLITQTLGVEVEWKPIVVGGVWNRVNPDIYNLRGAMNPYKERYFLKDLGDWARRAGLTIHFPPACGHPVNAVNCMRLSLVADEAGLLENFAIAAFEALWSQGRDLGDIKVLEMICGMVGLNTSAAIHAMRQKIFKDRLRSNGDELMDRGGFGSPTFFVNGDDMYYGNDRLMLVEDALILSRQQQG